MMICSETAIEASLSGDTDLAISLRTSAGGKPLANTCFIQATFSDSSATGAEEPALASGICGGDEVAAEDKV